MSNMPRRDIGRIFTIICIVVGLLHGYIGFSLLPYLKLSDSGYLLAIIALVSSAIIIPSAMLARFLVKNEKVADVIAWAGFSAMGFFSSLLVLTFARDVLLVCSSFLLSPATLLFLQDTSAFVVVGLTLLATLFGFINAKRLPAIVNVDIPLKNLSAALNGFTIVQISDVHIGPTIKGKYLAGIVNKVNALKPQLVAITGDLVDGSVAQLAQHVAPLQALRSDYGSYFVTGNHEYYSGVKQWINYLEYLGVRVLMNEHEIITHQYAQLIIAGITDFAAHQIEPAHASNPQAALAGSEHLPIPKIVLAHQPRSAERVAAAGADLQLSGHTHGGQFWPWNFFVPLQQPFTTGLHKLNDLWIYVNRGTGYWGPPKRLGLRAEITRVRLVPAQ